MDDQEVKGIVMEKLPNKAMRRYHTEVEIADVENNVAIWGSGVTDKDTYRERAEETGEVAKSLFRTLGVGQIIINRHFISVELTQNWMLDPDAPRPGVTPEPLYSFEEVEPKVLEILKNEFEEPGEVEVTYQD